MSSPVIIIASLMRLQGTTGVQSHMGEFVRYLTEVRQEHEIATPFHALTGPILLLLIALRKVLEHVCKPAAVAVYRGGHAWLLACRLRWLLLRHRDCVIYAQCPVSADVALRCLRHPTQRVALVVHFNISQAEEWIGKGMIERGGRLDRRIRLLEASVVKRVQGLLFVSRFMQSEMSKVWPQLDAANVAIIPNFVSAISGLSPLPGMAGRDLVCIGTLEPRKNQAFLLDVLAEARSRGRRLSLTLVGDGPDRSRLTERVRELGLQEQVHFEGFSPQGRTFIKGHRVYVHAALMENLPVVLLESLSAGVPVVAGQVGGIPEVFEDGVQGRFWPLTDPVGACEVLLSLLNDDSRLQAMRLAALQRFEERFELHAVAGRLREFLVSLPAS